VPLLEMEKAFLQLEIMERTYEQGTEHYTAEEKVAIWRRHLLDKLPVSTLREEVGLRPTVFYRWQKEFFENGASWFTLRRLRRTVVNLSVRSSRIRRQEHLLLPSCHRKMAFFCLIARSLPRHLLAT
jgi:transposase-like protein